MKIVFSMFKSLGFAFIFCVLSSLISCKQAQMTNTVVVKAQAPDGHLTAILVDRYLHAARVSDGFFLIVMPTGQDTSKAINSRDIEDFSALIATSANKVQLRWQNDTTLIVICDSCGIQAIDISKKLDHIGSTKIIYQGFPEHTAYS